MKRQLLIIVSVAVVFFLIGTMFSMNYLVAGKPPSVWDAITDLQTQVNSLNNTVIEQQAQISELQTQIDILNVTKLGTPDYDSGWSPPNPNGTFDIDHNLGTMSINVLMLLQGTGDYVYWYPSDSWVIVTPNRIHVTTWTYNYRIMIWKIPQP